MLFLLRRFFPIGTEVSRIPQKDIVIGGYEIPAGVSISSSIFHLSEMDDVNSETEIL